METNTDAAVAESSTAVSAPLEIPKDGPGYSEWRMTGKLPETPKADSTTAKKTDSAGVASGKSETASEAATGKQENKDEKRTTATDRVKELLDDIKNAGLTPAELKTFRKRETAAAEAVKTVEAPKVAEAPKGPVKPKQDDYATYDLYEAAVDKWHEDVADFRADLKLADRDRKTQAEASARATAEKLEAAGKRYGEESKATIMDAAAAIFNDARIPPPVKALLDDSPVIADLLYTLGKGDDLKEFVALCKSDPGAAIRKAVLMEHLIREELAKPSKTEGAGTAETAGRDASTGKFTPPAKKVSGAPPPPKEAGGRSSAPPDELERASTDLDFASYRKLANERDLARHKGR